MTANAERIGRIALAGIAMAGGLVISPTAPARAKPGGEKRKATTDALLNFL